jgi:cytosine permease
MNRMLTFKIREQDRQNWGSLALIIAGKWICLSALMMGGILIEGLSLGGLLFCVIAGGLILLGCALFMGILSCRSGLPSTIVSADGLGVLGARCISALLISITSIGWFGVQAALCGASFSVMVAEVLGLSIPAWGAALFWGVVMAWSAMYGYQSLKSLYYIVTPVLFLVLVFAVIQGVFLSDAGSAAVLTVWRPERPMSYIRGISLVMGTWAVGAFTVADFCRYAKKPRHAVLGISIGLAFGILAALLSGAVFRIITGSPDITALLNNLGFPAMALIFLVISTWAINIMNAYYCGIAVPVLLGLSEKHTKITTILAGAAGTALGAAGILSRFSAFLSLLSSLIPPIIGVLMGVKIAGLLRRWGSGNAESVIPSKPIKEAFS